MRNTVLAKRYAKALFAVGKEDGALDDFSRSLAEMAELFAMVPEVSDALTNPLYPVDVRAKVMAHLVQQLKATQMMANFLNLLVQKKRADIIPDIAEAFQAMVNEERNVCTGTVTSAITLDDALTKKVQETLEKITGKQVMLKTVVDPSIIGGIVAKVGDLVLDGSIRTQLAGLKESIKGRE